MITKKDFDELKRFDQITDSRGRLNGYTWEVESASLDSHGDKIVVLVCLCRFQKPETYSCRWSKTKNCMVSCLSSGEVITEFNGEYAYVHKESVDQIAREWVADKVINEEQARRLKQACNNDIEHAFAVDDCH